MFYWVALLCAPVVGSFAKFAKSPFYLRHVCPSIQLSSWNDRTDFHKILYLSIFRKSVEIIQVLLISDKNNSGTLHEDQYTFWIISRSFLLRMKSVSVKVVEKIKTHFVFNNIFFFRKSCRLWDNVEKYRRAWETIDDNRRCALYAGYRRLQIHTQNM